VQQVLDELGLQMTDDLSSKTMSIHIVVCSEAIVQQVLDELGLQMTDDLARKGCFSFLVRLELSRHFPIWHLISSHDSVIVVN